MRAAVRLPRVATCLETFRTLHPPIHHHLTTSPSCQVAMDPESGQTIVSGMGELHLEIYIERMKREYKVGAAGLHFVVTSTRTE